MNVAPNFGRTATRPLLLIVALFCALAIGLTGFYALSPATHPVISSGKPFAFYQDRPGPDSPSRNKPVLASPDDWSVVGH